MTIQFADTQRDDGEYVYRTFRELADARQVRDTERYNNLAALYSHQWSSWNEAARKFTNYLTIVKDDRVRLTINKMKPIMAARTAFIIGDNPTILVNATSPETKDKNAAYIAQRVIRADWEENKIWDYIKRTWEWTKSCGIAFTQTYYDAYEGKFLGYDENNKPWFEGRIKQKILSPFSVVYDPLAVTWEDCKFVIVGSVFKREKIIEMGWGNALKDLDPNQSPFQLAATGIEELYYDLNNPELVTVGHSKDEKGRRRNILVLEYFQKPCKEYPQGRYLVVVGKQIVKEGVLEIGEIPIVPFFDSTEAGVINAQSPVSDMRPIQEELNRVASLALERMQMPDIYAFPRGGGFPTKRLASRALVVGEYMPNMGEPKFVAGGLPRQDYLFHLQYYESELENIAGVSSLALAEPKRQMSGRFGYMVDQANRQLLSDISDRFSDSVTDLVRKRLKFVKKYYTDERLMSYINEYDKREVIRFTSADIGSNWAVSIRLKNSVRNSDEQRANRLIQLSQNPLITQKLMENPQTFKKWISGIDAEIGHELFVAETDIDVAQDENYEISLGGQPQVLEHQNHALHKQEHKRQLDSDTLHQWQPEQIAYLRYHFMMHDEAEMAEFRKQAYKQMLMQYAMMTGGGTPPGAGGGAKGSAPLPKPAPPGVVGEVDRPLEKKTEAQFPQNRVQGGGT